MKTYSLRGMLPLVSLFTPLFANGQEAHKTEKPNIIFVLADDMSYRDLSCYGQQRYKTPHLDSLAMQGVRFSQAYAAAPESAPSRCCMLTGLHTGHSSVRMNSSARGQDNILDSDVTVAEVLKEAGYHTAFVGKWGIGLQGTEGVPYKQGFDYCFGFYDQTEAHTYIPDYLYENDRKVMYPQNKGFEMARRYDYKGNKAQNTYDKDGRLYISELKDPYGYAYSENEMEKAAMNFLKRQTEAKDKSPFFLYYATQLPHGPVIVDELGEMKDHPEVNQLSREWAAMVMRLDSFVGKLVAYLKQTGQYENTIIFFASDNGYSMCGYTERGNGPSWPDDPWLKNKGPFRGGKFTAQEGGLRVPFFVSCPSKFKPEVISTPVWLPDFFPTAAEIAGLDPHARRTDGISLLPLLKGEKENYTGHKYLYFSRGKEQGVRMGAFSAYRADKNSPVELYLTEEDTYWERDLAFNYPEMVKEAIRIMDSSFTPHPWYWTPDETFADYQKKVKRAKETGNILPVYRPNGIKSFPWEKKK